MIKSEVTISIPFHDVDIMYVAWHGHYFKYFELARTQLMRGLSLDWPKLKELSIAMPIVDTSVSYRKSLLYGEEYRVEVLLNEFDFAEMKLEYRIYGGAKNTLHSFGTTRQVYVDVGSGQPYFVVPEPIADKIESYLKAGKK
jgi:acyl-CoA thioester hydrolase